MSIVFEQGRLIDYNLLCCNHSEILVYFAPSGAIGGLERTFTVHRKDSLQQDDYNSLCIPPRLHCQPEYGNKMRGRG